GHEALLRRLLRAASDDELHQLPHPQRQYLIEIHAGKPPGEVDGLAVLVANPLGERHELDALELEVLGERCLHSDGKLVCPLLGDHVTNHAGDVVEDALFDVTVHAGTQLITRLPSFLVSTQTSPTSRRVPARSRTGKRRGEPASPVPADLAAASLADQSLVHASSRGSPSTKRSSSFVNESSANESPRGSMRSKSIPAARRSQ